MGPDLHRRRRRSVTGLEKMISIVVRVAGSFGLMVSEPKAEIMCLLPNRVEEGQNAINAADQTYKQTDKFVYFGGTLLENGRVDAEIASRIGRAWACSDATVNRHTIGGSSP